MERLENLARRRLGLAVACILAFLAFFAAYANFFNNGFHFDDHHVIGTNLYIRSLENIPLFFKDAGTTTSLPANAQYRPLLVTTLALDYWLGDGLNPTQFHITQFLLMSVLGILLVLFYNRLLRLSGPAWWTPYLALFMSTVYCVHTANSEAMNIISARTEIIAALGVIGSFLAYLTWPRLRFTYLFVLPMSLGAFAKVPAVMFAPLLFMYVLLYEKQAALGDISKRSFWLKVWRTFRLTLPVFVVGIALFVFIERMNHPESVYAFTNRWDYLITQPFVWVRYVQLFFFPIGLTADTDWQVLPYWYDTRFFVGMAVLIGLLTLIVRTSRYPRWRPVSFGLSWFFLGLLPASSIFPLSEVTNDHRMFFPYIGLILAVAWAIIYFLKRLAEWRPQRRSTVLRVACVIALLVISGNVWGTHVRNKVWLTEESLWFDVTQKSPQNGRGLMNYGLSQAVKGDLERARKYFEAARIYTPTYNTLEVNLGAVYAALGQQDKAEYHFKRALLLTPNYSVGLYQYGRWLLQQGRGQEGIGYLEQALRTTPGHSEINALLMALYAGLGKRPELNERIQTVLQINPQDQAAQLYQMGYFPAIPRTRDFQTYMALGAEAVEKNEYLIAAQAFQQALLYVQDSADAYNNLGWSLGKLGFHQDAVAAYQKALELNPDSELVKNNLAVSQQALAEQAKAKSR